MVKAGIITTKAGIITMLATVAAMIVDPVRAFPDPMKIGLNLAGGASYDTASLFYADLMRQASGFGDWKDGPPAPIRPDGWPTQTGGAYGHCAAIVALNGILPPGDYTITMEGKGIIWLAAPDGTFHGQAWQQLKADGTNNTFVIPSPQGKKNRDQITFRIFRSDVNDPIRNVRFLVPKEYRSDAHPFYLPFLENLKPFSHLRFMDWMGTNASPVVKFEDFFSEQFSTTYHPSIPLKDIFQLCNLLKKACWICIPHMADDDCIRRLAEMADASLVPDIPLFVEFSNETWNFGFKQFKDMEAEAAAKGRGTWQWIAQKDGRAINLFKASVKSGRKCVRIVARQAGYYETMTVALDIMKQHGYGYDALSIAPYFQNSLDDAQMVALSQQYNSGQKAEAVTKLLESCDASIDEVLGWTKRYRELATSLKVPLYLYECGQHLARSWDDSQTPLCAAANQDARMGKVLYRKYVDGLAALGVDVAVFYHDVGLYSKWGYWGHKQYTAQPESECPKWQVIKQAALRTVAPTDPVKPPVDPVKPPVDPVKPPDPAKPVDPVKPVVDPISSSSES